MAKVQSVSTSIDDQTTVVEDEPMVEVKTLTGTNHDANLSGKKEMLTIHSSGEENGGDAVFVSHNGYAFQIPRDTPCLVPTEVAQILRDAKTTIYQSGNGATVNEVTRPRYAFSSHPVVA